MASKTKTCLTLFTTAFYISAVTFGSGYVMVSVIKKRFVDELKWIDEDEMINMMALAQSSPGVISANTAMLVGYKMCGIFGAILAVLGVALPPLITVSIISLFYNLLRDNAVVSAVLKGMQAGACAVICDVVFSMFTSVIKGKGTQLVLKTFIMAGAFAAAFVFNVNFIFIILSVILLGVIWHFVGRGKRRLKDDPS